MTTEAPVQIPKRNATATAVPITSPTVPRSSACNGMVYLHLPAPDASHRLEILYVRDSGTGEAKDSPTIGIRFSDLAEWWHSDTDGLSVDRESYEHPAYRRIIEDLGKAAIPYILADLRDRHGHWFDALRKLTGDNTVDAAANGSMRRARDLWLRWGRAKKLI